MKRKVAFFDLDGTLGRGQQIVNFINLLCERGIYPMELRKKLDKTQNEWSNRTGSFSDFIFEAVNIFHQNIRGQNYNKFRELAEENAENHWKQIYSFTSKLIDYLRAEGCFLVLISHAPKIIIHPFAKKYGFDKMYGRFLETDAQGNFTGGLLFEDMIIDKAKIVDHVIKKYNFSLVDSVAVGDSEGDISMLSAVERPLCMNPNSELYKYAKQKNWPIVVERKDVVYVVSFDQEEKQKELFQYLLK